MKAFSIEQERAIDFVAISDTIPKLRNNQVHNHFAAPKTLIKLWDGLKKKLRDPNKRENEFQALCRIEVNVDFWTDLITKGDFKQRMGVYNSHAKEMESFKSQEDRFRQISSSYFNALTLPKAQ